MLNDKNGITITMSDDTMIRADTNDLFHPLFSVKYKYTGLKMVYSTIAPSIELDKPRKAKTKKQPNIIMAIKIMLLRCL